MPTWNNLNSALWTDSASWIGGVPNAIGAQADFVVVGGTGATIATFTENTTVTVGTLNITSTGARDVLFQGSLADTGSGVATLSFSGGAATNSIARVNITTAVGGGEFEISSFGGLRVSLANETEFNVATAGTTARINAPIIGSGGLVKLGAGTLQLGSASSTMSGFISVEGGTLSGLNGGVFGTGSISLHNNAILRTSGTLTNATGTTLGETGTTGSGQIMAPTGTTLTMAGNFGHKSAGVLTLGNSVHDGTIALAFGNADVAGTGGFRIDSATLRFDNAYSAGAAFYGANTAFTELVNGAVIDGRGFLMQIKNLDLDAGTIRSSTGALNLLVGSTLTSANSQNGTIEGTANADSVEVNIDHDWSFAATTFTNWSSNDTIRLDGSANANTITGSTMADIFNSFGDNDTLFGNGGADQFFAGDGDDLIVLNAQNGNSQVTGGNGTDTMRITGGSLSLLTMSTIEAIELQNGASLALSNGQFFGLPSNAAISGTGTISVSLFPGQSALTNNFAVAAGSNITFNIQGAGGNETITIHPDAIGIVSDSGGNDTITGGNRGDTITILGGVDTVNAMGGDDLVVIGNSGASANGSHVNGGDGIDTLRVAMGSVTLGTVTGFEAINMTAGTTLNLTHGQLAAGFATNSVLSGTGTIVVNIDSVGSPNRVGTKGMSVEAGSNINFVVNGNAGNDRIKMTSNATATINTGDGALNVVQAGNLNDTITGGSGVDKLAGNGGVDILTGGGGADVFKWRAVTDSGVGTQADVILDFQAGVDRLNFVKIDADAGIAGDQAFQFMGTGAFAGNGHGSIRWVDTGADLRVEVDVDGDFIADMHVILQGAGAQTLAATDFVL